MDLRGGAEGEDWGVVGGRAMDWRCGGGAGEAAGEEGTTVRVGGGREGSREGGGVGSDLLGGGVGLWVITVLRPGGGEGPRANAALRGAFLRPRGAEGGCGDVVLRRLGGCGDEVRLDGGLGACEGDGRGRGVGMASLGEAFMQVGRSHDVMPETVLE